jgi:hypothetical protein
VIQVVNAIRADQRGQYESRRADLVSNFPAADKYAHPADYVFGENNDPVVDPSAPGAAPAAPAGFDLNKWLKDNPPAGKKP